MSTVESPQSPAVQAGTHPQLGELPPSFGQQTDMGRAAQPEEIAPDFVLPAAPVCSGYISGLMLPVTGSIGEI